MADRIMPLASALKRLKYWEHELVNAQRTGNKGREREGIRSIAEYQALIASMTGDRLSDA